MVCVAFETHTNGTPGAVDDVAGAVDTDDAPDLAVLETAVTAACGALMAGSIPGDVFSTTMDHSTVACSFVGGGGGTDSSSNGPGDSGTAVEVGGTAVVAIGSPTQNTSFVLAVASWTGVGSGGSVGGGDEQGGGDVDDGSGGGLLSTPQSVSVMILEEDLSLIHI